MKGIITLIAFAILIPVYLQAQEPVYDKVDLGAEYIDGETAMYELIDSNKKWPEKAVKAGITGKVFLRFIVTRTGKVENVNIESSLGYGLDEESIRLIKLTDGYWKPAFKDGKAVNSVVILPIRYY